MSPTNLMIYGGYNILSLFLSIKIISYLNTYINSIFIPNNFRWNNEGVLRTDLTLFGLTQFVIANIEAHVLLVVMYFINRSYVGKIVDIQENGIVVVLWTEAILYFVLYILIFRYFYYIYK